MSMKIRIALVETIFFCEKCVWSHLCRCLTSGEREKNVEGWRASMRKHNNFIARFVDK